MARVGLERLLTINVGKIGVKEMKISHCLLIKVTNVFLPTISVMCHAIQKQ